VARGWKGCWTFTDFLCLRRYYMSLGFVLVDDFVVDRPGREEGPYEGALLRMDL
jgi:hypothetical protein